MNSTNYKELKEQFIFSVFKNFSPCHFLCLWFRHKFIYHHGSDGERRMGEFLNTPSVQYIGLLKK